MLLLLWRCWYAVAAAVEVAVVDLTLAHDHTLPRCPEKAQGARR